MPKAFAAYLVAPLFITACSQPPDAPTPMAAHRITVDEALPMMTINSAYALFRDEEVGSLKAGKHSDYLFVQIEGKQTFNSPTRQFEATLRCNRKCRAGVKYRLRR